MRNPSEKHGARIALVPGSFKPPHGGHLYGVRCLLESASIDEVVIIISARARRLPGSTKAIDSNASELMWRAMLGDERRVRIECAPNSAAEHAIQFIARAPAGTTLLFCVGEEMFDATDSRYRDLQRNPDLETNVSAEVWRLPTSNYHVHTAQLCELLAQGEQARKQYVSLLEERLPRMVGERLWQICQSELRDIHSVTADKLLALNVEMKIASDTELTHAHSTSQCLEFDAQDDVGNPVRLKHIGDEIAGRYAEEQPNGYPRNRLASARRCLRWLARQHGGAHWYPRIHFFDASRRILAETKAHRGSHTLMSEFIAGKFDVEIAARLGKVVAKLHSTPVSENPVRGSWRQERAWWKQRRSYWYERLDIRRSVTAADDSADSRSRSMVHLNLAAENVILCNGQVTLIAFECASSIGDPMLDVLVILSNFLTSGVATHRRKAADRAAESFARSYQESAPQGAEAVRRAKRLILSRTAAKLTHEPAFAPPAGKLGAPFVASNASQEHFLSLEGA